MFCEGDLVLLQLGVAGELISSMYGVDLLI